IETVVRELDLELAAAVAQPYALARACASEEVWADGGIFVDVGGGTTDVALVRDGGVEGTRMFNLGGRAFTRRLALAFGLSYEEAEARKLRHSEGLLSAEQHRQVSELLTADAEALLQGLALSWKELSRGEHLPSPIYLCGGGSLLPELTLELSKNAWASGLPFAKSPKLRHLVPPHERPRDDAGAPRPIARGPEPFQLPAASQLRGSNGQEDHRRVRRPGGSKDGVRVRFPSVRHSRPPWRRRPIRIASGRGTEEVVAAERSAPGAAHRRHRSDPAHHQERDRAEAGTVPPLHDRAADAAGRSFGSGRLRAQRLGDAHRQGGALL